MIIVIVLGGKLDHLILLFKSFIPVPGGQDQAYYPISATSCT